MPAAFDTSQVSPSDAAVTLRSLRRRFREALARPGVLEAPGDPLRRRPADGGLSPAEDAAWTAAALSAINRALRQALVETDPTVELPAVDVPPPVHGGGGDPDALVSAVGDAADALADTISGVSGPDWTRVAQSPGPVTVLDMARLAVRISVEHLRAAEEALTQVAPDDDD